MSARRRPVTAWICDLHDIRTDGDCPKCDAELISMSEED